MAARARRGIFALVDPRTGVDRWIFSAADAGAYVERLTRPSSAIRKANPALSAWLDELARASSGPEVRKLAPMPKRGARAAVAAWIEKLGPDALLLHGGAQPEAVHTPGDGFDWNVAGEVIRRVSLGESIRSIARDPGMPARSTIVAWGLRHPEFRAWYEFAREAYADEVAEQALEIAHDGRNDTYVDDEGNEKTDWDVLGRSKLRIDTLKWHLGRMSARYHPRHIIQHEGGEKAVKLAPELPPLPDELQKELARFVKRALQGEAGSSESA